MANMILNDGKFIKATGAGTQADPFVPDLGITLDSVEIGDVGITSLPGTVEADIATSRAELASIDGHVDGIEGLLTTIDGRVDGLEGQIGATNETAAASDSATSGLNGLIKRLLEKFTRDSGNKGLRVSFADTTILDDNTTVGFGVPDAAGTARPIATVPYVFDGVGLKRMRTPGVLKDLNAVAITTIATVWTPAASRKFRLMGMTISVSAACSVLFEDNTAGVTIFRTPQLMANTPYNVDLGAGKISATINNVLKATASTGTVTITGTLYGSEET